ncbi:MAG: NADH-quinone oxidoreductase subunit L [bacterium]
MLNYVWWIPLLPLITFCVIIFFTRKAKTLSAYLSILTVFVSFILSGKLFFYLMTHPKTVEISMEWFRTGRIGIELGILIDPLTGMMVVVVTLVSLLIQIYSLGYMHGDPGLSRYYAFLSLFTFSMLTLVVANNFIEIFIGWELVGLCSYALIGFWYQKPEAAAAGKKAFITTRVGDVGFMIGILLLFSYAQTFNFLQVEEFLRLGTLSPALVTFIAVLIFCGAVGKSAQFPLHVWLPDAMEGPTPVSALIHAATMVAAGVYLVGRLFGLFAGSDQAMVVVAYIGGFTAILAGTIAVAQNDIKRIVAYSTLSQLGYMMLALGCGGYTAGLFHLMTHAFFKALLFLAAGSVIHAIHSQDIWEAGGLFKPMKITAIVFLLGSLSLAGIPPLAGFWSKDEILLAVHNSGHTLLFTTAIITVFLTAFYTFRLWFVVFTGEEKEGSHAHESPAVMTIPMIILAVLAVVAGLPGSPWMGGWIHKFIHFEGMPKVEAGHGGHGVMYLSLAMAALGIATAWIIYKVRWVSYESIAQTFSRLHSLFFHKYWIDEFYGLTAIRLTLALAWLSSLFDQYVIDGLVNGTAWTTVALGRGIRTFQTGLVQNYILIIFMGMLVFLLAKLL